MVRFLRVFYWVVTERLIIRSCFLSGFNFIFFIFFYCNLKKKKNLKPRHPRLFELPVVFRRTDRANHHQEQLEEKESTRTRAAGHRKMTHALVEAAASGLHSPAVSWRVEARAVASGWLLPASVSSCGDARTSDLFWAAAHWKGL